MSEVLLRGRYRVTNLLGGGGFSRTYLALDTQLPDCPDCVVKQLKPPRTDAQTLTQARRLFHAEAKTLRSLHKHDRIPELLAYFEDEPEQNFYMVQEFIPGKTFKQILSGGRRFTEAQAIYLLKSVLEILDSVHGQNTIHLDIKPSNLIHRHTDNAIVLIDFGAVKQVSTQVVNEAGATVQTAAIGTPGYMPCEQSYGRPKFSSDLYALGMVVIQALTGCHPTKLREDLQTGDVIWQDRAAVSPEFSDILSTMVRYHFGHRFHSAREALNALDTMLANRSTRASMAAPPATEREATAIDPDETLAVTPAELPPQPPNAPAAMSEIPNGHVLREPDIPHASPHNGFFSDRPELDRANGNGRADALPELATSEDPATRFDATLLAPPPAPLEPPTELVIPRQEDRPLSLWRTARTAIASGLARTRQQVRSWQLGDRARSGWQTSQRAVLTRWDATRHGAASAWHSPQKRAQAVTAARLAVVMVSVWAALYGVTRTTRWVGDRLTLSRAISLAETDLSAAIAKAEMISASSPTYARAEAQRQIWQQHLQHRQILERAKSEAQGNLAEAIALATSIPAESPSRAEADVMAGHWQQTLADRDLLDRVAAQIASSQSANLTAVLQEMQEISPQSELYSEARSQIETILALMLSRSNANLARTQPSVQLEDRRITVSYDGSANSRLSSDEGMRRVAIAMMGVLRAQYLEFDQLTVFPRQGDRETTLDLSLWIDYKVNETLTLGQLLEKMPVVLR